MNSYNRENVLNLNYFINDEEGAKLIQNNSYLMQGLINVSLRLEW